jgi:hypothetical protein
VLASHSDVKFVCAVIQLCVLRVQDDYINMTTKLMQHFQANLGKLKCAVSFQQSVN